MTDTANLEDGFYWVRGTASSPWIPAEFSRREGAFYLFGCRTPFSAINFIEIDPRPIKRDNGGV